MSVLAAVLWAVVCWQQIGPRADLFHKWDQIAAVDVAAPAQSPKVETPKPEVKPKAPKPAKIVPPAPEPAEDPAKAEVPPVEKSVVVTEQSRLQLSVPNVPGVYTLTIPASGRPTLAVQPEIIVLDPDVPGPGPAPVPGNLTDFGKAIKAAADKATGDADRVNTAQGLAMLYRGISAEAHKAGTAATTETVSNTTLLVTDMALTKQGPAAVTAWAGERAALRAALVDAIQTGKTVSQMGDLLDQAAAGLEASAPKSAVKAPSPAFWAFLLKLLEIILSMLKPV